MEQAGAPGGRPAGGGGVRGGKLLRPRVAADAVERPRLLARLDRRPDAPLVLLSGPGGSGKTTLLGQWLGRRAGPAGGLGHPGRPRRRGLAGRPPGGRPAPPLPRRRAGHPGPAAPPRRGGPRRPGRGPGRGPRGPGRRRRRGPGRLPGGARRGGARGPGGPAAAPPARACAWCWRRGPTRPCPWPGCGPGASCWSCAPPTCASPPPRRPPSWPAPSPRRPPRRRSRRVTARTEGWAAGLRLAALALQGQGAGPGHGRGGGLRRVPPAAGPG